MSALRFPLALVLAVLCMTALTVDVWLKKDPAVQVIAGDPIQGKLKFYLFVPNKENPLLAHYTEHLAWLPNIGKDSRPEDRDSNAWTNDYAVGYWLSGPPQGNRVWN